MARTTADSATSGWFIHINDQPSLDFGGDWNADGQGFDANRTTNTEAQRLTPPIRILEAVRLP